MDLVTLGVAVASVAISLATAGLSWWWRKDTQYAAVTAFRTLVARKTVVEETLRSWELMNVHDSVLQLRDEMAGALPTVSRRAATVGEEAVQTCKQHLLALRDKAIASATRHDSLGEHPELDALHRAWVGKMHRHLDVLDEIRGVAPSAPPAR